MNESKKTAVIGTHSDSLLVENIGEANTPLENFSQMIQKKTWNINDDHLTLSLLMVRLSHQQTNLKVAIEEYKPISEIKSLQRRINRIYSEIARRLSAAFAIFSLTILGISCGICIGRHNSTRGITIVILLSAIYLAAFFSARSIDHLLTASLLLYSIPHLLIIFTAVWMLKRTSHGVE